MSVKRGSRSRNENALRGVLLALAAALLAGVGWMVADVSRPSSSLEREDGAQGRAADIVLPAGGVSEGVALAGPSDAPESDLQRTGVTQRHAPRTGSVRIWLMMGEGGEASDIEARTVSIVLRSVTQASRTREASAAIGGEAVTLEGLEPGVWRIESSVAHAQPVVVLPETQTDVVVNVEGLWTVSGNVVAGEPGETVRIYARLRQMEPRCVLGNVVLDADGKNRFRFPIGVARGTVWGSGSRSGISMPAVVETGAAREGADIDVGRLTLEEAAALDVEVTDARGQPIPSAFVRLRRLPERGAAATDHRHVAMLQAKDVLPEYEATTDESGVARIVNCLPGRCATWGQHPEFAAALAEVDLVQGEGAERVTLVLGEYWSVGGTLVDQWGESVEDAKVRQLLGSGVYLDGWVGDNGRFGIPSARIGWSIAVDAHGFERKIVPAEEDWMVIELESEIAFGVNAFVDERWRDADKGFAEATVHVAGEAGDVLLSVRRIPDNGVLRIRLDARHGVELGQSYAVALLVNGEVQVQSSFVLSQERGSANVILDWAE